MKKSIDHSYSSLICFIAPFRMGQEIPPNTEQQLENLTDADQTETEDDSYIMQLQYFKKHPLNLNEADAGQLKELFFLTDLQIENLLSYRHLLGKFISIYELQAIPAMGCGHYKKNSSVRDNRKFHINSRRS